MFWPVLPLRCTFLAAAFAVATPAYAAVSVEEAAQLGGPVLTLFGAEKAGNKEGTIPPYTGTGPKKSPRWDPKNPGQRPDPYDEKPLYSITAENAAQYADKLDGMIEVFKRHPNFRMDIYPTHRDAVFPQYVLDRTVKNATACTAVEDELKLKGCYGGLPFPIPKTGKQAMWNHLMGYQAWTITGRAEAWTIPYAGSPALVARGMHLNNWPVYDPNKTEPLGADELYWRYLSKDEEPPRSAGGQMMLLDAVDQYGIGRRAYLYVTGRRWAKLTANLAYDTPNPYSGGASTMDEARGFLGAMDRYEFELLGKKEKYIYYNNYVLSDEKACPADKYLSSKGFPHPDCVRWELHRVWAVKAMLKPGMNHLYPKRMLYWDEDGYVAGLGENYDTKGKLYRVSNNIHVPFFETPASFVGSSMYMDLGNGVWASSGATNCKGCGWTTIDTPLPRETFDPDAMSGAGIR